MWKKLLQVLNFSCQCYLEMLDIVVMRESFPAETLFRIHCRRQDQYVSSPGLEYVVMVPPTPEQLNVGL